MLSLKAFEVPGVKVLRFESSLYFGNVERFRNALIDVTGRDPSVQQKLLKEVKLSGNRDQSEDRDELLERENGRGNNYNGGIPNGVRATLMN